MPVSHQPIRAFQWDLARQVERLDWLLAQLPRYAEWGYQELYLHLEDAVEYPRLPGVARADAYTYRQLEKLVATATRVGIGVVPIVNLLGHTQYLIKVPELRDLNELRAADGTPLPQGQICPLHPRTLEVAEKLLRDMLPFCTTGKVHVGLDESFHLGKHPLSQAEVARIGLGAHFANHVKRLQALNQSLGLRTGMWADMLYFLPEAIPLLPRGLIAYDWYYYPFRRHPRVEFFNFVERDLARPLQRQGIEYWGCPMNGAFRFEPMPIFGDRLANIRSWWDRCQRVKAQGFLVTSWEPNRLAMETTTTVDAAAASLWLDAKPGRPVEQLARGIKRLFSQTTSPSAKALARAVLRADAYAFAGYARWEINKGWHLTTDVKKLSIFRKELRYFTRLLSCFPTVAQPDAFKASLEFRHYLAQRDVFVRETINGIHLLRRRAIRPHQSTVIPTEILRRLQQQAKMFRPLITTGQIAARMMWQSTRTAKSTSPNLQILKHDMMQLTALVKWLAACKQNLMAAWRPCPVGQYWQVYYDVLNFAPAVQSVSIEQLTAGGWRELKTCYTIEFQAKVASRRSHLVHTHAADLFWQAATVPAPHLRFVLRGSGQVKIARVFLTNGCKNLPLIGRTAVDHWHILGKSAPIDSLPNLSQSDIWTLAPSSFTKKGGRIIPAASCKIPYSGISICRSR